MFHQLRMYHSSIIVLEDNTPLCSTVIRKMVSMALQPWQCEQKDNYELLRNHGGA